MIRAGFMQIYNEESKGNLRRCLDSMSRYCDIICIYDDASTDNSFDVTSSYDKTRIIRGEVNEFGKEIYHKEGLLNFTLSFNPDWIFWMDCDEVIERRGEDGTLRELAETTKIDAHGFKEVNLWRCDSFYRLDNAFNAGEFCRLWRNTGKLSYNPKEGLHQRQYPDGIGEIATSDLKILHYGFSSDDRIIDKYTTYKAHGQYGWALQRLVDERTLQVAKSNPDWFRVPPAEINFEDIFSTSVISRLK